MTKTQIAIILSLGETVGPSNVKCLFDRVLCYLARKPKFYNIKASVNSAVKSGFVVLTSRQGVPEYDLTSVSKDIYELYEQIQINSFSDKIESCSNTQFVLSNRVRKLLNSSPLTVPIRPSEIARRTDLARQQTNVILRKLNECGIVKLNSSTRGGRARDYTLSELGRSYIHNASLFKFLADGD